VKYPTPIVRSPLAGSSQDCSEHPTELKADHMCPNCAALAQDPEFPHSTLKWRLEEFDPTATEALGSKVFEVCTVCEVRWYDSRTRQKAPAKRASSKR
jgi:hypothetical protein